ncbi:MAG TPA: protein TolR [Desulfomonilaceae bacterium]|nr:protein TolR [Desulfomonilaceae bacterium]
MAFSMQTVRKTVMSEINVTPLVDVMLVLLIIFMVTAPMLEQKVSVDLPQAKGEPLSGEEPKEKIIVSVSGQGSIYVNEVSVPEDRLAEKIAEAAGSNPSQPVYLRADRTVIYGKVVRVMVALKAAGIPNVGMITTPEEEAAPTR